MNISVSIPTEGKLPAKGKEVILTQMRIIHIGIRLLLQ